MGYAGNKTAFYSLVAGLRAPRSTPIVRFEGLPGEFSQHDFGQVDVRFVDGRTLRVHFFASRLKYSRFVAVTLVENERAETIVRCLARDFVAFGGLPLLAVFDRPKTIVKKGGKGREVGGMEQHLRPGDCGHVRAAQRQPEGVGGAAGGLGEGCLLQAQEIPR